MYRFATVVDETRAMESLDELNKACADMRDAVNSFSFHAGSIWKELDNGQRDAITDMAIGYVVEMHRRGSFFIDGRNEDASNTAEQFYATIKDSLPDWAEKLNQSGMKEFTDSSYISERSAISQKDNNTFESLGVPPAAVVGMYMASPRTHNTLCQTFGGIAFYHLLNGSGTACDAVRDALSKADNKNDLQPDSWMMPMI
jgi:hypothetical protein